MSIAKFEKVSFEEWQNAIERLAKGLGATTNQDHTKEAYEKLSLPKRATKGSAGYDFFAPTDFCFHPSTSYLFNIPTGVRCNIEDGYFLQIVPKSGLGTKYGFAFVNTMGIIDSDYYHSDNEGHIHFCIKVTRELTLSAGDKMFQGIFLPHYLAEEEEVCNQRNGGHGSTGA